jgi:hypothetical protein
VSTRKLILTALVCGLAILLAGGIQLVLLAGSTSTAKVLTEGASATVGGVVAAVVSSADSAEMLAVTARVEAGSTAIADAGEGWALLRGGELRPRADVPVGGTIPGCDGLAVAAGTVVNCLLAFVPGSGTAIVSYSRGGEQSQWTLSPVSR